MEVWELNLLHDGDIERICMGSDEWPLKQENCHASVSVNDKLHSIVVKISTQDDNTVELWEYKWECIHKEPHKDKSSDTLLQKIVSCMRDVPKLFYDWAEDFCWKARKNGYLQ